MAGGPFFIANAVSNIRGTIVSGGISDQRIDPALLPGFFLRRSAFGNEHGVSR